MTQTFPWVADVTRGAWIAERVAWDTRSAEGGRAGEPPREALAAMVPSGFPALVRVLHPFGRDRPATGTWAEIIEREQRGEITGEVDRIDETEVPWAEAASVHGSALAPGSLSFALLGIGYGEEPHSESSDGWRYRSPEEGSLVAPVLARVATVLAKHTATPDRGVAAVWEGWGGLTSASGVGFFFMVQPPAYLPRFLQRLVMPLRYKQLEFRERRRRFGTGAALRALLGGARAQPAGSGVLSKEAVNGPRFKLPDRDYICFEAGIDAFAEAGGAAWPARAPWIDETESWWIQSPNLIWPDGREWALITEIDFDSTLIACTRECAEELLRTPGVEAIEITRDTPLWRTQER